MAGKKFKCPKCGSADDFLISGIAHDKVMYLCEIQVTGEVDTIDLQHEEIVSTIWDDIFKCEGCGEKYSRREIAGKPPKAEKIMCPEGRLSFDPVTEQWEINAQGVFGTLCNGQTLRRYSDKRYRDHRKNHFPCWINGKGFVCYCRHEDTRGYKQRGPAGLVYGDSKN